MRVGDICTPNPIHVSRTASILEAARQMRHAHVGAVVVVDRDGDRRVPVGILTDRDVVVGVLASDDQHIGLVDVGTLMRGEVVTARSDEDVAPVVSRMRWANVRRVPVVDEAGSVVGVLSLDDVLPVLARQLVDIAMLLSHQPAHEHEDRP